MDSVHGLEDWAHAAGGLVLRGAAVQVPISLEAQEPALEEDPEMVL